MDEDEFSKQVEQYLDGTYALFNNYGINSAVSNCNAGNNLKPRY
ncbi:MAG: hypothetical protein ACR5K7_05060 [Symbiopectobacterium sp.]